jgi:hypothetical protein
VKSACVLKDVLEAVLIILDYDKEINKNEGIFYLKFRRLGLFDSLE